jgi:hypothetical protein
MLARLALLFVMLPTLAIAAAADVIPDGGKLVIPPPPKPDPVVNAAPKPAVTQSPYVAYAAPTMPAANASECRMDCAQTLYFCQASDHAEYCPSGWTECVAACNSPALNHAP